ncbi:hypothetical protein D9M68_637210 [compost metagenome]
MRVLFQGAACAFLGEGDDERQGRVVQRQGRSPRHRARHIGHAVMHHVVDHIGRLGVGGGFRGFRAAALVDGHIHQYRAGLHHPDHFGADQLGRGGAGNQHTADHQVGRQHLLAQRYAGRVQGGDAVAVLRIQATQGIDALVQHRHIGPQADRHGQGVATDHATAKYHHLARRHARHAAKQHATTAPGFFQATGTGLDRHASGHFGHRRQQRQTAMVVGDGFVGDAGGAAGHQLVGLRPIRRKVQVGEQGVLRAQPRTLDSQRLLDLDDQLRRAEHRLGAGGDLRAGGLVIGVAEADGGAGLGLDPQLMAEGGQFGHRLRRQADAVFVILDLFGYADAHSNLLANRLDAIEKV